MKNLLFIVLIIAAVYWLKKRVNSPVSVDKSDSGTSFLKSAWLLTDTKFPATPTPETSPTVTSPNVKVPNITAPTTNYGNNPGLQNQFVNQEFMGIETPFSNKNKPKSCFL